MRYLVGKKWFLTLVALVGLFAIAPAAKADPFLLGTVPLAPGGTVVPGIVAAPPGTLLASLIQPLSGGFTGTLTTAVFREAGGTLDFYYQFSISTGFFDGLTTTNFTGFATQVGFRFDGSSLLGGLFVNGTMLPTTLADRNAAGNLVGFSFGLAPIAAPFTSGVLVSSTDATTFT